MFSFNKLNFKNNNQPPRLSAIAMMSLVLLAQACQTPHYRRLEPIESKMSRYAPKPEALNQVPTLIVTSDTLNAAKSGRGPASAEEAKPQLLKNNFRDYSNKRLYFLALYTQYSQMLGMIPNQTLPEVQFCPHFHSSVVEYKEQFGYMLKNRPAIEWQKVSLPGPELMNDENFLAKNPELLLPLSEEVATPTVADYLKKVPANERHDYFYKGLTIHLKKTYGELQELCEYGSSDNYYTFENLITHVKQQKTFGATVPNMQVLLKSTVLANQALMTSLNGRLMKGSRMPASQGTQGSDYYSQAVLERLDVPWANQYFKQLARK